MSACVAELRRELEDGECYSDDWADVSWRMSPGSVVVDDADNVPTKYWVRPPRPDKKIDKNLLKKGVREIFDKSGRYPDWAHVDKQLEVRIQ